MKFYVDEQYHILSIDKEPESYFIMHEEAGELAESIFADMCNTCIRMYKHGPVYKRKVNGKNEVIMDAFGSPELELDESEEKIIIGWETTPYVDWNVIASVQQEHDTQENKKTELQLALAEQYETNLFLQDEVTNTQIALADLFEGKGV